MSIPSCFTACKYYQRLDRVDQLAADEVQLILAVELGVGRGLAMAIRQISVLWTKLVQHEYCGCGLAEDLVMAMLSMPFYTPG